jgi:SAM-dependent methyltransferase
MFSDIKNNHKIYLYAGDMDIDRITKTNKNFIGLSLTNSNNYHIKHDVTKPIELNDNTVDIYQSEDVFEHIEYLQLNTIFNEIYRVLKPGGLFRLSIPDYKCDILQNRSLKDACGNIFHDPGGGGNYDFLNNKVINGGHVWFPNFNLVYYIFEKSNFNIEKVHFLHYYDSSNNAIVKTIDYNMGYISRTPDNDSRVKEPYRPMSIVVDCYK